MIYLFQEGELFMACLFEKKTQALNSWVEHFGFLIEGHQAYPRQNK